MKVVLLSGGSGTRLWPVSTEDCPKQYVPFFKNNNSMFENTYNQITKLFSSIYIATQKKYQTIVKKQIDKKIKFIIEPQKIGTFGAILNTAVYLKYKEKVSDDEFISIVPTDHDVDKEFYKILLETEKLLETKKLNVCLVGIKPTNPSNQYGYIIQENNIVKEFIEKPSTIKAKKLIKNNALWNSGIVVFKLKHIINLSKKYLEYEDYNDFIKKYNTLPNNSFDREYLEKEKNICVIETNKKWNDLGTWDTMSNKISQPDEFNTNIINFENKEIKNKGISNSIIVNSKDGLLLLNKNIEKIYWKEWGYYKIIFSSTNNNNNIKIKQLNISKDNNISYQYHNYRNEDWYILSGTGKIIKDKKIINITAGDRISIKTKELHCIRALTDLIIIETQYGEKTEERDIVRIEKEWNKIIEYINGK